jgi:putative ABC transport system permease protein
VAIGSVMARRHGLDLGDRLEIMGRAFTVVGTSTDAFMASFVFMTHEATDALLSSPGTTSFVLVGTDHPDTVRQRLEDSGVAVLDRDQLARADLDLMARAYRVPLTVMRAVAFAIGSIVIALTVYTAIADRRREYGIVKAMGAQARRLTALAVEQSLILATIGIATGGMLFLAGRALISELRPQFVILASTGSVSRAAATGLAMGLIAALVPARRLARLEPAAAYRGA